MLLVMVLSYYEFFGFGGCAADVDAGSEFAVHFDALEVEDASGFVVGGGSYFDVVSAGNTVIVDNHKAVVGGGDGRGVCDRVYVVTFCFVVNVEVAGSVEAHVTPIFGRTCDFAKFGQRRYAFSAPFYAEYINFCIAVAANG